MSTSNNGFEKIVKEEDWGVRYKNNKLMNLARFRNYARLRIRTILKGTGRDRFPNCFDHLLDSNQKNKVMEKTEELIKLVEDEIDKNWQENREKVIDEKSEEKT